jgi:hypothetical protein
MQTACITHIGRVVVMETGIPMLSVTSVLSQLTSHVYCEVDL